MCEITCKAMKMQRYHGGVSSIPYVMSDFLVSFFCDAIDGISPFVLELSNGFCKIKKNLFCILI